MKAYTSLVQSQILAVILPLESADMFWLVLGNTPYVHVLTEPLSNYSQWENYPCWSLAALLDVLPYPQLKQNYKGKWCCITEYVWEADNPVDACVEMIKKLHELKLL